MKNYSTYLLLDTAMMGDVENRPWAKSKRRPDWLIPLYERDAWRVSPVIVDIEAAFKANRIGLVTSLVNCVQPQLHASFIDTELTAAEVAEHLRQFIYIVSEKGEEITLRLADCIVLPWLQSAMTPAQWAAFHGPIINWKCHRRNGTLATLPHPDAVEPSAAPIRLTGNQITSLEEAHEPDQLLSNLQKTRNGHQGGRTPQQAFALAVGTLKAWKTSGQSDSSTLLFFARGVFDTEGKLLRFPTLPQILAQSDLAIMRKDIQNAVSFLHDGAS